ncbi:hypothetical protein [Spirulina sp. 06S082]|uniref:hypothetical protein n=1 Tax=Spirulina sp. 06S082 TaxID=3110248 RepID=UPI002B204BAF|nr:hypothetical protein [Spirulina sp. 06S082]MEA5472091.1 hypothetical protein [Spirulina sp. 06S082]
MKDEFPSFLSYLTASRSLITNYSTLFSFSVLRSPSIFLGLGEFGFGGIWVWGNLGLETKPLRIVLYL